METETVVLLYNIYLQIMTVKLLIFHAYVLGSS